MKRFVSMLRVNIRERLIIDRKLCKHVAGDVCTGNREEAHDAEGTPAPEAARARGDGCGGGRGR